MVRPHSGAVGPVNVLIVGVMFPNARPPCNTAARSATARKGSLTLDHVVVGYNRVLEPGDYGGAMAAAFTMPGLALIDGNVYGGGGPPVHGAGLYNASQAVLDASAEHHSEQREQLCRRLGGRPRQCRDRHNRPTPSAATRPDIGGGLVSFGHHNHDQQHRVRQHGDSRRGHLRLCNTRIRIINGTINWQQPVPGGERHL